jgi:hypothetical protein
VRHKVTGDEAGGAASAPWSEPRAGEARADEGQKMVSLRRPQSFVVRVSRGGTGRLEGIVERPRTGEKVWFQGVEQIGPLIARMLESDPSSPGQRGEEKHG